MKFHEAVGEKLANTQALTDVVGSRMYPIFGYQEDVTPLIIWDFVFSAQVDLQHGWPNKADLTVLCYADDADGAIDLAYKVRDALHEKNTRWGVTGSLYIGHCSYRTMTVSAQDTGDGTFVVVAAVEFSLLYGDES